jgi:hypothetical protein
MDAALLVTSATVSSTLVHPCPTTVPRTRCVAISHSSQNTKADHYGSQTDEAAVTKASSQVVEEELASLARRIDVKALARRASSLRNGITCAVPDLTADVLEKLPRGGMNVHLPIRFVDGVEWICRVRRENAAALPLAAQDRVVISEATTLRFLSTKTRVPVPKVFDFSPPSAPEDIGIGYILMEKVSGHQMDWFALDEPAKRKVLDQLADVFASLLEHPFDQIGCLEPTPTSSTGENDLDHDGGCRVGPLTAEQALDRDALNDDATHSRGPYKSTDDYVADMAQAHIDHVLARESYRALDDAADVYLALRAVQSSAPLLSPRRRPEGFFLKHMDDKGDHIFIDDEHNIIGIIDWEWAQTLSAPDAFCAPLFLVDVGQYYDGVDTLSADEALFVQVLEEKGHLGLAALVREGRLRHRLAHIMDDSAMVDDTRVHLSSFRRILLGVENETWDAWKAASLKNMKGDAGLERLRA